MNCAYTRVGVSNVHLFLDKLNNALGYHHKVEL